jgi:hypothetical protein
VLYVKSLLNVIPHGPSTPSCLLNTISRNVPSGDNLCLYFEDMNAIDKSHFLFPIKLLGRTINKEFITMIIDWLNWLEDDNILWNKQIKYKNPSFTKYKNLSFTTIN